MKCRNSVCFLCCSSRRGGCVRPNRHCYGYGYGSYRLGSAERRGHLTNTGTNVKRVMLTNTAGNYIAPQSTIGTYTVKAEAAGFKTYARAGIKLDSNDTVRIDVVLQIGQVSESVTVAADAVKVESDSSESAT